MTPGPGRNDLFVTHGDPDPRNVLKSAAGFVIVDWDFVQLAPPERDLWDLAETDRSVLAAYTEATGTVIDSGALALFRMWYDLSEIAGYIDMFRSGHDDTEDSAESWKNLEYFLRPAERWPQLPCQTECCVPGPQTPATGQMGSVGTP